MPKTVLQKGIKHRSAHLPTIPHQIFDPEAHAQAIKSGFLKTRPDGGIGFSAD